MDRPRIALLIGAALIAARTIAPASAQGVPDWAPAPTFVVVREHTAIGDHGWLRPYELDVLAPRTDAGMAGPDDAVTLACHYHAGSATFATVDGRANYECDDGRWLMGDPVGGTKLFIVIVPQPTLEQLSDTATLPAQLALISKVTIAIED